MSISLHTLLYVEGYDNAAAVRDVMFRQGWVTRGFTPNKIKLDEIERYQNIIVWAYTDRVAKKISAQIPGAFPVVAPKGLDAQIMAKEGILQPYLEAVLVDTRCTKSEVATWTL
jgi:5S rRNA maturation endonuclease (ribonuclease M5)